jgi:LAO/AO transport system kinase
MNEKQHSRSALKVNPGIEQPPTVNPNVGQLKVKGKKSLTPNDYFNGILGGNVAILGQAITLIESSLPKHQAIAQEIVERCLPLSGRSLRIGITGVPGVGKSTFIEALGAEITSSGNKLAVLAVDPSSERSKGSILGDKTRMETLSANANAYIRPSPSAGSLGGVARKTRETIILCEAAGYNTIFIETVGVGQSETVVHSMVDFFLLLMLAGAGDELQGIKRGIMEMADLIAITKADGQNIQKANMAKAQYANALHLFPAPESGWSPRVRVCSSVTKSGIDDLWNDITDYVAFTKSNEYFFNRRVQQSKYWLHQAIDEALKRRFYGNKEVVAELKRVEAELMSETLSSFAAAKRVLQFYEKI